MECGAAFIGASAELNGNIPLEPLDYRVVWEYKKAARLVFPAARLFSKEHSIQFFLSAFQLIAAVITAADNGLGTSAAVEIAAAGDVKAVRLAEGGKKLCFSGRCIIIMRFYAPDAERDEFINHRRRLAFHLHGMSEHHDASGILRAVYDLLGA